MTALTDERADPIKMAELLPEGVYWHQELTPEIVRAVAEAAVKAEMPEVQKLLSAMKYIVGIAERGEGRQMRDDESAEQFVLGYVKRLECCTPKTTCQKCGGLGYRPTIYGDSMRDVPCLCRNQSAVKAEREGQEPAAWMSPAGGLYYLCASSKDRPLYTAPPAAPVPDRLHEIVNGQWWMNELLTVFESGDWSVEQRTALDVVVEMTRVVEEMLAASQPKETSNVAQAFADKAVSWEESVGNAQTTPEVKS